MKGKRHARSVYLTQRSRMYPQWNTLGIINALKNEWGQKVRMYTKEFRSCCWKTYRFTGHQAGHFWYFSRHLVELKWCWMTSLPKKIGSIDQTGLNTYFERHIGFLDCSLRRELSRHQVTRAERHYDFTSWLSSVECRVSYCGSRTYLEERKITRIIIQRNITSWLNKTSQLYFAVSMVLELWIDCQKELYICGSSLEQFMHSVSFKCIRNCLSNIWQVFDGPGRYVVA